jgi:hypothetical protein
MAQHVISTSHRGPAINIAASYAGVSGSNLGRERAILIQVLRDLPQYLQVNFGIS